jgi:hypothetical protein
MVLIFCRNLLQQIGLEPPLRQGQRCTPLSPAPRFRDVYSPKPAKKSPVRQGRSSSRERKAERKRDGRTNGFTWGAPKPVRPSCGCMYPLVERRTDTRPATSLSLQLRAKRPPGWEIVTDCLQTSPFEGERNNSCGCAFFTPQRGQKRAFWTRSGETAIQCKHSSGRHGRNFRFERAS